MFPDSPRTSGPIQQMSRDLPRQRIARCRLNASIHRPPNAPLPKMGNSMVLKRACLEANIFFWMSHFQACHWSEKTKKAVAIGREQDQTPHLNLWVVRVGEDDGELRPRHFYIYVYSIKSRPIMRIRYDSHLPQPGWASSRSGAAARGSPGGRGSPGTGGRCLPRPPLFQPTGVPQVQEIPPP